MLIGCPDPQYYGNDCSKRCHSSNCQYCHIETGTCLGCQPAYQGHGCKLGMPFLNVLNILLIFHELCVCVDACASVQTGANAFVFGFAFSVRELSENTRVTDPEVLLKPIKLVEYLLVIFSCGNWVCFNCYKVCKGELNVLKR